LSILALGIIILPGSQVWMCGGKSVWVPCSRVSHVYRGHSCSSCHSGTLANKFNGVPTTLRNYKRVIETWFDEPYKEYFYTREPLARFVDMGDISDLLQMKKEKNCKSFDWFMKVR
jgi:polypeptide N-acetylgalactosaminyltransferase